MQQDKNFYIIVALLVIVVILLVMVLVEIKKPVTDLLDKADSSLEDCNVAITGWVQKYPSGVNTGDAARDELGAILSDCSSRVGK